MTTGKRSLRAVRVSTRGRVVIPREVRDALGLTPGSLCSIELANGKAILARVSETGPGDWRAWEGILKGTSAVEDHLKEHRREIEADHLS